MKFTLDSNVWEKVTNPEDYCYDNLFGLYKELQGLIIKHNEHSYWLSMSVFSQEEIEREYRLKSWKKAEPKFKSSIKDTQDGICMSLIFGPDDSIFEIKEIDSDDYRNHREILYKHAKKAFDMGFKVIDLPIVGVPFDKEFVNGHRETCTDDIATKAQEVDDFVREELKTGQLELEELLEKYGIPKVDLFSGIKKLPYNDKVVKEFSKAMAEWGDANAIIEHISHGGDYFVTSDYAKGAGSKSIMSSQNVIRLEQKYGFKKINPHELRDILK